MRLFLRVLVFVLVASTSSGLPVRLRFVIATCPGCVVILTTDTAQTIIDGQSAGTSFIFESGTHRMQTISPRTGDVFFGQSGAILSGAKVLASGSFVTAGSFWKITGQTQTVASPAGECQMTMADGYMGSIVWATSYPGCRYNEQVFYDNVALIRVTALVDMGLGEWYFDDAANEIYVGTDPAGHVVETSVTAVAFANPLADNVTIDGLIIEKYASRAQYGAIDAENTAGWVVTDCILRLNHSGGIRIGGSLYLARNDITSNGQEGVVGIGDDVIVEYNEISYNNTAHFDPGWEGGGTKFVQTLRLLVRYNYVHHNEGPGLWTDIDNEDTIYEYNTVEDNDQIGIFHEISWAAIIRYNTVNRNGLSYWCPGYTFCAGITIAASKDVDVTGNTLAGNRGGIVGIQQSRGSGTYGTHLVQNLIVSGNSTTMDKTGITPTWTGIADDTASSTIFTTDGNAFENNTYLLKTNTTDYFVWSNAERDFTAWQGFFHDTPLGSASTY